MVIVAVTYRVSDRRLQWCVLLLLAADMVKGEENVVMVRQGGGELDLDLIMKVRGSVHSNNNKKLFNNGDTSCFIFNQAIDSKRQSAETN